MKLGLQAVLWILAIFFSYKIYGGIIGIGDNSIRAKVRDKVIKINSDILNVNFIV